MDMFFERWVKQVWEERKVPDNAKWAIRKKDSSAIDMAVMFQVRHRSDGIKLPDELKAPTPADHILMELTSPVVGLTAKNAAKLVQDGEKGEILITEEYFMPDFNGMLKAEDEDVRTGAEKVFRYIMGEKSEPITDEERAKILQQRRVVRVKDGFLERSFTYCDSPTQLGSLLNYMNIGKSVSNPEFAKGDKQSERNTRIQETVVEFLCDNDESGE